MTVDQDKIRAKVPDISSSGLVIDKDGTVKFVFNLAGIIKVEKNESEWEDARSMFMTFQVRSKLKVVSEFNETLGKDLFNFTFDFKGFEISLLKIYTNKNVTKDETDEDEVADEEDDEDRGDSATL